MNDLEDKILEVIDKALALKEQGKPISEILRLFPGYENELEDVFRTIAALKQEGTAEMPDPALLRKTLAMIPDSPKGRNLSDQIINPMSAIWKIAVPAALVVLIGIFAFSWWGTQPSLLTPPEAVTEPEIKGIPTGGESEKVAAPSSLQGGAAVPVTGRVDDVVAAIFSDADSEQAALSAEEADASYAAYDSQAIADFGQSYEDEF